MDDFTQEHDFDLFDGGISFEHRAASGNRGSRIKVVTEGGHAFSLYQEEARALCQWLAAHVPSVDPAPVNSGMQLLHNTG